MARTSVHHGRAEKSLLLWCARTRPSAAATERIRALSDGPLVWETLYSVAADQGVVPLLYSQLQAACPDLVPAPWLARLREAFHQNARRNLLLAAELLGVLEGFAAAGVPAVPFKGPVLAEQAYGNLSLRQFADLDIVLRQRDISQAAQLLSARGYILQGHAGAVSPEQRGHFPGQYLFRRQAGQGIVELHTERTLRYFPVPLDLDDLSRRLKAVPLAGRTTLAFSAEDSLPMLCVHGSKHFWGRLSWLADVAELSQAPAGLDWEATSRQARALGAERMMHLGLALAGDLLGAQLPQQIEARVRADHAAATLMSHVKQSYFAGDGAPPGAVRRLWFRLLMRGSAWRAPGYVLRLASGTLEGESNGEHGTSTHQSMAAALRRLRH